MMTLYKRSLPPDDLPSYGTLNSIYPHNTTATLEGGHMKGQQLLDLIVKQATSPNVINKQNGEFLGIIFKTKEEPNAVSSGQQSISTQGLIGVNIKDIRAYRVYIPEFSPTSVVPDNFHECDPTIGSQYPLVPFPANIELSVGDIVHIRYTDKANRENPIGIAKMSTTPLMLTPRIEEKQIGPKVSDIAGSPPPIGLQIPRLFKASVTNCALYKGSSGEKAVINPNPTKTGLKDCWTLVKGIGKVYLGRYEMVKISEGSREVFPKKYIKAIQRMRQDYKEQSPGSKLELGIISAYRDVDEQAVLYTCHQAKLKINNEIKNTINPQRIEKGLEPLEFVSTNPTAPPGTSLHNSGRAIDFDVGGFASKWKNTPRPANIKEAYKMVAPDVLPNGTKPTPYGPVARWLVENASKYGFIWTGWSFSELWHYEIDDSLMPEELIDNSAISIKPDSAPLCSKGVK